MCMKGLFGLVQKGMGTVAWKTRAQFISVESSPVDCHSSNVFHSFGLSENLGLFARFSNIETSPAKGRTCLCALLHLVCYI